MTTTSSFERTAAPAFLGLGALLLGWLADPGTAPHSTIQERAAAGAVADSPRAVRPLLVGAEIPDLVLKSSGGEDFDLRAACAEQPRIVVFYRGGW